MKKEQLIKLARELTEENYCFGFDYFVECYDKAEWLEFFEDYEVTTKAKLIPALNESVRSSMAGDRECYYVCFAECLNETRKCDVENTRDNPKEFCDCNFYPSPQDLILFEDEQFRFLICKYEEKHCFFIKVKKNFLSSLEAIRFAERKLIFKKEEVA